MKFPVILEGVIESVVANKIMSPSDFRGLQNKTPDVLRIDELRFQVMKAAEDAGLWIASDDGFATAEVQLRIGNDPITADFVPLPAMTWPMDFDFESDLDSVSAAVAGSALGGYYTKFAKPVYLAPGQAIMVQFKHGATVAQRFVITAICRPVNGSRPPGFTPWIAKFSPVARTDGTGNFVEASTEADLVNPFDDEMMIERLIGRIFWGIIGDGTINEVGHQEGAGVDEHPQLPFNSIRVRIEDHEGTQIVRDATPFGIVFEFIRKSWMINAMLPAKGFYRVSYESNLATQVVTGTPQPIFSKIGMLGYRAVR